MQKGNQSVQEASNQRGYFRQFTFIVTITLLLCGTAAVGVSGIFIRLSEVPPTESAFYRIFFAVPFLWIFSLIESKELKRREVSYKAYCYFVIAGIFFGADLAFWHWSITLTSIANANLFGNMAPIVVIIGSFLIFKERLNIRFFLGLIVVVSGAIMLLMGSEGLSNQAFLGDLLGLVTALFYGIYLLMVNALRKSFGTFKIMFWSSLGSLLVLLPASILLNGQLFLPATLTGIFALISLALITHVGGQGLIAYALAKLPASLSSVMLFSQPIFAALFAFLLLGESMGGSQVIGALIVLSGLVFAIRSYQKFSQAAVIDDREIKE